MSLLLFYGARSSMRFIPASATLTPSMAVRAGALFAGAPIVQGGPTLTPDILSYSRGSQIAGNWYAQFDPAQGTYAVIWRPEKSRDATQTNDEYLFYVSANYYLRYEHDNARFAYAVGGQAATVSHTSAAGTARAVVLRWNVTNTLDGTNYACLSINDTHSFGVTTAPTASAPGATIYVGNDGDSEPANALLGGGHFYRRVWWDGTYGINVGNGDEINLHYAAGAFADPSEVVRGAWDAVFALPTNAKPGALTTGTGHAWTHPHASNLLGVGGFMLDGTYTNDGWADEGTPSAVAALAAGERIYQGGYKTTSDAANEGIYKDIAVTAGDDWVIRVVAYSDGTSVPRAILYDQTNGAEIGHLDGATTSTRTAPNVLLFTGEAPAGCVTLRVKLVNTAASGGTYWAQAEVYTNLVTNPSLETGAGNPWIPTGWTNYGLGIGDSQASSAGGAIIHSGSDCIELTTGASNEGVRQEIARPVGDYIGTGAWVYGDAAVNSRLYYIATLLELQRLSGVSRYISPPSPAASWQHIGGIGRSESVPTLFAILAQSGATGPRYVDDMYAILLTAVSLTATPASAANSVEGTGLRVDGRDTLTMPVANLKAASGDIRFTVTQRHNPATVASFGVATPYLVDVYQDANNYIRVYWSAANTLTIAYNAQGAGAVTANYDATGQTWAGTAKAIRVTYGGSGAKLYIDGVNVATAAGAVAFATTFTNTVKFGQRQDGTLQLDGVIS